MKSTLLRKINSTSRQFSPLILYHKHDSLDYQQTHQNNQQCQPHNINMETRIHQHLVKTNNMLERNAELWVIQECKSYATLSDKTAPLKKGFVSVILENETTTDQNEDGMNDIITNSSTSSTLSNSSTDSNDSTIITITTPICQTRTIPTPAPVVSQPPESPTTMSLEPKTNINTPSPLYQPNMYITPNFYRHHSDDQHPHSNQLHMSSSTHEKMPVSPIQHVDHSSLMPTTEFVASFRYHNRSKWIKNKHKCNNKPPLRAAGFSPSSSAPHLSHAQRKKGLNTGMKKRRRGNLPKHVTEFLKTWLLQHKEHPYPTERQKVELAQRTDLAVNQVSNWFINARRRILHPMLETEQQLRNQYFYLDPHQPRYYPSPAATSTSSALLSREEEEEKRQHLWENYATHGHKVESPHHIHHWSPHRSTKLPTIEIPGKDQYFFATVS